MTGNGEPEDSNRCVNWQKSLRVSVISCVANCYRDLRFVWILSLRIREHAFQRVAKLPGAAWQNICLNLDENSSYCLAAAILRLIPWIFHYGVSDASRLDIRKQRRANIRFFVYGVLYANSPDVTFWPKLASRNARMSFRDSRWGFATCVISLININLGENAWSKSRIFPARCFRIRNRLFFCSRLCTKPLFNNKFLVNLWSFQLWVNGFIIVSTSTRL